MSLADYEASRNAFDATRAHASVLSREAESAELDRLALLSPFEYGRERIAVAERFQVAVRLLDREIDERKKSLIPNGNTGSGQRLILSDIEPATEPVSGSALLSALTGTLANYVILPEHAPLAIALWILRAYLDDMFDTSPRLSLTSPEKRCGKTTVLEFLEHVVPRPLSLSNIAPAVLFRTIEAHRPTLLIDEMDSFHEAHEELRGILNSGHRRSTARVVRCVGDEHEPRLFSTWTPMVLAMIGRLPDTVADRSILVPMRRKAPGERVQRLTWSGRKGEALRAQLHTLARGCARWAQDHRERIRHIEPALPETLNDRQRDNWAPLLAIGEAIGEDYRERASKAAIALSGKDETEGASAGIRLLADIRVLFKTSGSDRLGSQQLCDHLAGLEESPWGAWGKRAKPISQNQLSGLLKPYGVTSRSIRTGQDVMRGYLLSDFLDAFDRYLTPQSIPSVPETVISDCYSATSRSQSGDGPLFQGATEDLCSTSKNGTNPAPDARCSSVALQKSLSQDEEHIEEGEAHAG
jgi:putative DNA primase/helicase